VTLQRVRQLYLFYSFLLFCTPVLFCLFGVFSCGIWPLYDYMLWSWIGVSSSFCGVIWSFYWTMSWNWSYDVLQSRDLWYCDPFLILPMISIMTTLVVITEKKVDYGASRCLRGKEFLFFQQRHIWPCHVASTMYPKCIKKTNFFFLNNW